MLFREKAAHKFCRERRGWKIPIGRLKILFETMLLTMRKEIGTITIIIAKLAREGKMRMSYGIEILFC